MEQVPPSGDQIDRLDSWKAIAAYLGRTERTARRWEQKEGLPVHRLHHHERGSVYAYQRELDAWRTRRAQTGETIPISASPRKVRIIAGGALALVLLAGFAFYVLAPKMPRTLAVLPFANESDDGSTDYLGSALAEMIIESLAGAPDLQVRPFASSLRLRNGAAEPSEIGRTIGADMVVTGSVRASGDAVQITLALVDVSANAQVWGTSHVATNGDLGAAQGRLAVALREQVLRQVHGPQYQPPPYHPATVSAATRTRCASS